MSYPKDDPDFSLAVEWTKPNGKALYIPLGNALELYMLCGMAKFVFGCKATIIPRDGRREAHEFPTTKVVNDWHALCRAFQQHLQDTTGSTTPIYMKSIHNFWMRTHHSLVSTIAREGNLT